MAFIKFDNKKVMVFIPQKGDSIYIGEFTLDKIQEQEQQKWKMIFKADENFIHEINKLVFEEKATGFSQLFPYTDNITTIINLCKERLNEFIDSHESVKLYPPFS